METTSTTIVTDVTRPKSVEDLSDWESRGHSVFTIDATYCIRYPSLGQHLLAALAEAERLGMTVTDGLVEMPKTTDELDQILAGKQRNWDNDKNAYLKALDDPTTCPDWRRNSLNAWARAEGVQEIDFEQVAQ